MSATATTAATARLGETPLDSWRDHPDRLVAAHCGGVPAPSRLLR